LCRFCANLTTCAPYQLPAQISREQFHILVTHLYQQLAAQGVDPSSNLTVEDFDEILDDGKTRPRFALFISESAAQILEHQPN